jgi:hypothetical protein
MMFAANPSWSENENLAIDVVRLFCDGARSGLSLTKNDPVMKAAMQTGHLRSSLKLTD